MLKKLKIYLDTSVINFLFSEQSAEKKEVTEDFFNNYIDDYDVFISELVIQELNRTQDENKKELLKSVITKYNLRLYAPLNREIVDISNIYITQNVVPESKIDDALHVAYCTFYEFDILLSWNFRHLANINKQEKFNNINSSLGYRKLLLLLNPMEVIYDKNN